MRGQSILIGKTAKIPHIGIDLLGSDTPPKDLLAALLQFSKEEGGALDLTVLGLSSLFEGLPSLPHFHPFVVNDQISMEDNPLTAVRRKKGSSLCKGIHLLETQKIDAFISAGNTGALIACSKLSLPMLPKIMRPALLALLPTKNREIAVLDVGANTSFKPKHLVQFALMGVAYQKCRGVKQPKIGLLNIGSEAKKGTPEVREAYERLLALNNNKSPDAPIFLGNIEGRDAFRGDIDVLVTDGFTGNVFLKTAEGIASIILDQLAPSPYLEAMRKQLHYAEYPGAILCGIDGIVVKCHGNSTPRALINSVKGVIPLIQNSFCSNIKSQLQQFSESFLL